MALSREDVCQLLFQPLDTSQHEIRFIHLHPAAAFDDPIVCSLDRVSLNKNVFFTAISWCWGLPDLHGQVIINGHSWAITSNLEIALRHLRYTQRSRALWIDALCVNQSTINEALRERNHQIQLMKLIFSKAPQVCIWLGVPDPKLKAFVEETILNGELTTNQNRTANYIAQGLVNLLSLPWWSRLWVVQEGTLGSKVEMQLGSARFIFHFLIDDIYSFWNESGVKVNSDLYRQLQGKISSIDIFRRLRNQYTRASDIRLSIFDNNTAPSQNSPVALEELVSTFPKTIDLAKSEFEVPTTLVELLAACRQRSASDARDKIYGLLGLLDPHAAAALRPDYTEPVNILFVRIVRYFIRQDDLAFLCHALPSIERPTGDLLPTWAPDWSITSAELSSAGSPYQYQHRTLSLESLEILTWLDWLLRKASQPKAFLPSIDSYARGYVLHTPGILIDTVSSCSHALTEIQSFSDWDSQLMEWQTMLCDKVFPSKHKLSFPKHRATYLTPQRLNKLVSEIPGSRGMTEVSSTWDNVAKAQGSRTKADIEPSILRMYWDCVSHGVLNTKDKFENLKNVLKDQRLGPLLAKATHNRRLFYTNELHLGNGPENMGAGDALFYLPGLDLPCLLRSAPGYPGFYTFVGECYIELSDTTHNLPSFLMSDKNDELELVFRVCETVADMVAAKGMLSISKYKNVQAVPDIYIV